MSPDRSRRYAELPGGRVDVQVEEDTQHDHLPLAGWQTAQRGELCSVQAGPLAVSCRDVMTGQRRFLAAPMPPGRPGVERGADYPGPGGWMMADLVPGRPRPGERLGGLVLGQRHVAGAGGHRPQAGIPACREELGELGVVLAHTC